MTKFRKVALTLVVAAAAAGPAAPAHADKTDRCETRYERLEERFRQIEERRGWETAAEWWNEKGWPRYYERCLAPEGN
jgi:hypothetical protein